MTAMAITGSMNDALTQCALFGVAMIIEGRTDTVPAVYWTDELEPRARIEVGSLSPDDVAELVHAHAKEHSALDNWVQATIDHEGRATGTFSPRIKAASSQERWRALQNARHSGIDALTRTSSITDLRFIGALGEPAYWRVGYKPPDVDDGASRWEMKTRNRGAEFIGNRLSELAMVVAARAPAEVLAGLAGDRVRDEVGNDAQDSRAATGLRRPGPTDNALAWCALWGISMFPIVFRTRGRSRAAGAVRKDRYVRDGRDYYATPVSSSPITSARVRSIIASQDFEVVLRSGLFTEGGPTSSAIDLAKRRLHEQGIDAVIRFPAETAGSTSAPERRLLSGDIVRMGGAP